MAYNPYVPPRGDEMKNGTWLTDAEFDTSIYDLGRRSVKFNMDSGDLWSLHKPVAPVAGNEPYVLSARVRADANATNQNVYIRAVWYLSNQTTTTGTPLTFNSPVSSTGAWETVTAYGVSPSGARFVRLEYGFNDNSAGAGTWTGLVNAVDLHTAPHYGAMYGATGGNYNAVGTGVWTSVDWSQFTGLTTATFGATPSVANDRITIYRSGVYQINAALSMDLPTVQTAALAAIYVNGAAGFFHRHGYNQIPSGVTGQFVYWPLNASLVLSAGDYVQLYYFCGSATGTPRILAVGTNLDLHEVRPSRALFN